MPAVSEKQKRFMDAAAHNPDFAKQAGIPVDVAKDFSAASKGEKFSGPRTRPDLQKVNERKTRQGDTELFSKGGNMAKFNPKSLFKGKESMSEELKEAKAIKSGKITPMQYAKGEKSEGVHKMAKGGGIESRGKTKGTMIKMRGAK